MKIKKLLAGILSVTMLASATAAFAAAPSAYDGQSYESLGYTSEDPDGQFNLAVIANGDVRIYGDTMYIKGSVYSNGTIYAGNGQGNKVDGLFISGTENTTFSSDDKNDEFTQYRTAEGFVHVNDNGTTDDINYYSVQLEHEGAILDKDTSFECSYEAFEAPAIANDLGDVTMTVYYNDVYDWDPVKMESIIKPDGTEPKTITEDTHIGTLNLNGTQNNWRQLDSGMIIDTTNGDVNVVIDKLGHIENPSIKVIGDHKANIYIMDASYINNLAVNYNTCKQEEMGNSANTNIYIKSADKVTFDKDYIMANTITVDAPELQVSGSTKIYSDINSNAEKFTITGGETEVTGTVCVPNADSEVINSGTLYGQLHTDTLTINGAGRIIWKADAAVAKAENEPTPEPVEPTPTPDVPKGGEVDLYGLGYAYIFGYEPGAPDENGVTPIYMAPNDSVTREQVASMLMRMIDQKGDTRSVQYPMTANIAAHEGTWYARGLAYLASKGTFDGINEVNVGPVTRGEVAKLVAYGLNLSDTAETTFTDIANNQYKPYIEIMNKYGYMTGVDDTIFEPDRIMTRAEFCKMFNNIIGREEMGLELADGTTVTAADYSIVDIDGHWAYETILKATSAYDKDGYVDFAVRQDNIRNKLDNYDSQMQY